MDAIRNFWTMHFSWLQLPTLSIRWTDILEIIILSFFIYHFLIWVRRTRTWVLLKGLLVLVFFVSLAYIFEMDTIKFLITRGMDVAMVAAVIVFQPELRRALSSWENRSCCRISCRLTVLRISRSVSVTRQWMSWSRELWPWPG